MHTVPSKGNSESKYKKRHTSGEENKTQWHYPLILTLNTNLSLLFPSLVYRIKHSHGPALTIVLGSDMSLDRLQEQGIMGAEWQMEQGDWWLYGGVDSERARWQCQDHCVSTLLPPGPWSATSGCRGRQRVATWHKCLTGCLETHRTVCLNHIFLWKST